MLTGVIDFARDTLLTGWARGSDTLPLTFCLNIDGAAIPAIGSGSPQDAGLVKFRVRLPRPIAAAELIDQSVTVEAVQGDERFILPVWKPIRAAAMLDGLDQNMIDRMISCLQAGTQEKLRDVIIRKHEEAEAARAAGEGLSPAAMSELMRWS